jgi:hypothetical protein
MVGANDDVGTVAGEEKRAQAQVAIGARRFFAMTPTWPFELLAVQKVAPERRGEGREGLWIRILGGRREVAVVVAARPVEDELGLAGAGADAEATETADQSDAVSLLV